MCFEERTRRFPVLLANVLSLVARVLGEHVATTEQLRLARRRLDLELCELPKHEQQRFICVATVQRFGLGALSTRKQEMRHRADLSLRLPEGNRDTRSEHSAYSA